MWPLNVNLNDVKKKYRLKIGEVDTAGKDRAVLLQQIKWNTVLTCWDFPVVQILHFHCRGHRFNP